MDRKIIRKRIKMIAAALFAGNWLRSFLVFCIQFMLSAVILSFLPIRRVPVEELINFQGTPQELLSLFIPKVITERTVLLAIITVLLYLLVMAPFSIGICRFFLKISDGIKGKISDVFSVYTSLKTVFSSVWLQILIFLLSIFWTAVFMLIPIAVSVCGTMINSTFLVYVATIISPLVALFSILWNSRYQFAKYILAEGKTKGAFSALSECISLMRNRTGECIVLRASYILWDVVSSNIPPLYFVRCALFNTVYAKYLAYLRGINMNSEINSENTAA